MDPPLEGSLSRFKVGDQVLVDAAEKRRFPATITKLNVDGTFNILWKDGTNKTNVPQSAVGTLRTQYHRYDKINISTEQPRHVVLFYKYIEVVDPAAIAQGQRELCISLNLVGRIRVACEGMNALLCGAEEEIFKYRAALKINPLFDNIHFKLSLVPPDEPCPFDGELFVRISAEITSTGSMSVTLPTSLGGTGGQTEEKKTNVQQHDWI